MLCEGGGGQRPLLRRCLRSPCSTLGQRFQVGGLVGLEPPLLVFARGLRWCKWVPPTLGCGGSHTLYLRIQVAAPAAASALIHCSQWDSGSSRPSGRPSLPLDGDAITRGV